MSLVTYLIYVVVAFSVYMWWLLGSVEFVEVVVPWLIFIVAIFTPLVLVIREPKDKK